MKCYDIAVHPMLGRERGMILFKHIKESNSTVIYGDDGNVILRCIITACGPDANKRAVGKQWLRLVWGQWKRPRFLLWLPLSNSICIMLELLFHYFSMQNGITWWQLKVQYYMLKLLKRQHSKCTCLTCFRLALFIAIKSIKRLCVCLRIMCLGEKPFISCISKMAFRINE